MSPYKVLAHAGPQFDRLGIVNVIRVYRIGGPMFPNVVRISRNYLHFYVSHDD
jgi:hypothetical protein